MGGVDFTTFVQNLVFKNETDVTIHHDKIFLKGLTVRKLIETQKINNISLGNILIKHGEQEITSSIIIQGNVQFDDNITVENINNLPVNMITDFYQVRNDQVELKGKGNFIFFNVGSMSVFRVFICCSFSSNPHSLNSSKNFSYVLLESSITLFSLTSVVFQLFLETASIRFFFG